MATALNPLDVEDLLRRDLDSDACRVCAPPVPEDLGASLPFATVERDGGTRLNVVMDSHNVTVCVWAATWAGATAAANALAGSVARLPDTPGTSTQWRSCALTALPYAAPDPEHPTIPRVQFTATVCCRAS